jgi:hypothetical protein
MVRTQSEVELRSSVRCPLVAAVTCRRDERRLLADGSAVAMFGSTPAEHVAWRGVARR